MACVFVLGPSHWQDERPGQPSPLEIRRRICHLLAPRHHAFLMEDVPDRDDDRDLTDKFVRILRGLRPDHVVLLWPLGAKMQTTTDEIIHLRHALDADIRPTVWLFAEEGIVAVRHGQFNFTAAAAPRSRYLDAVRTLGVRYRPWRCGQHLDGLIQRFDDEIR